MKLGLIAMSGVRAHNPELLALGLTMPGVVERSQVIASLPSLGLLTLAGLTPPEIDVHYLEVPDLHAVDGVPAEFDVVAIASFTAQIQDAYALAARYRQLGTKVILGGLHVTACPAEAQRHADAIVLGEGELAWPQVMRDCRDGRLQAVYDVRPESFALENAPMPRHSLLDPSRYNRFTIQTQRGCPFRCEFCAASLLISPQYKRKPVAKVMAELESIRRLVDRPFIEFADDNTFVHKPWSKELMRALAPHHVRWFTETDISVADDPELLALMRDAGCAQVLIGLESTTFGGVDGVEQRGNWKAKQVERYLAAIDRIQSHGITVNGCFILGLDTTGAEVFEQVEAFVQQSKLYEVQVTVQTAFPGTPLYIRLRREGRLLRDEAWELCTLFDVNFRPLRMSVEELEQGLRRLITSLYSAEAIEARRGGFQTRLRERWRQEAAKRRAVGNAGEPSLRLAAQSGPS